MLEQLNGENSDADVYEKLDTRLNVEKPYSEASGKVNRILAACNESKDLETLASLATSTGGLVDDEVRRKACMLELNHHNACC